jgi:spoIIIJ-associated protein
VEWVETTGRTVEEAKDEALDRLGVDEQDAEFDVVEEPRPGLFGRMRGEARVRARVTPKAPPPKQERRDRKRRDRPAAKAGSGTTTDPVEAEAEPVAAGKGRGRRSSAPEPVAAVAAAAPAGGRRGGGRRGSPDETASGPETSDAAVEVERTPREDRHVGENVTVDQQADIMVEFLEGLTEAFGYEATIARTTVDEETVELNLEGEDLGLLIGPKGATLAAVQDLARTVVQRTATGTHEGRVRIDVSGYRQRRRDALERFTKQVAAQVIESGEQKALEPMAAVDRKVVHDTVNEIDGVVTTSEGEEPRRRVVILPSAD